MSSVPGNTTQPIELSDDDDEITIVEDITAKKAKICKAPKQCLNVQCKNGKEFIDGVPAFVLSYYKVRKKNGLKVCEECFGEACTFYTVSNLRYIGVRPRLTFGVIVKIFTGFEREISQCRIHL